MRSISIESITLTVHLTSGLRELLGIVQAAMTEFFRKNYCSSHNRTRQRPPTNLINPGNPRDAGSAEFFLITKSAAPAHAAYYAEILMVRSEM
jgi:hypothetical protein